jgi:hypothetical protein
LEVAIHKELFDVSKNRDDRESAIGDRSFRLRQQAHGALEAIRRATGR